MAGYSVSNLVAEYDGERSLVLRNGEDALIDHNQATRHAPGIDLLVLNEVELPLIILQIVLQTSRFQIGGHCIGQVLPYPLHHRRILGIGREFGALHKLGILLSGKTQDIAVADHQRLLAARNGHSLRGTTATDEYGCH